MTFKCRKGCSGCCGPIPIPMETYETFKNLLPSDVHIEKGKGFIITHYGEMKCGFLNRITNKCKIYASRPQVCREFGMNPKIPCPYIKPDGTPRTVLEQKKVRVEMEENVKRLTKFLKEKNG